MKQLILFSFLLIFLIVSVNSHHCSKILKLDCEKYCYENCSKSSLKDSVVCELIKSICKIIGCCHDPPPYSLPFECPLPKGCETSYEGPHGFIRYYARAILETAEPDK
uniref:Arrestin-like N-terminal domain-containing protein n=1 Tax=Meloidogyne incognita TaxID=6306 RepID=A0A914MCZ0_MELIC